MLARRISKTQHNQLFGGLRSIPGDHRTTEGVVHADETDIDVLADALRESFARRGNGRERRTAANTTQCADRTRSLAAVS